MSTADHSKLEILDRLRLVEGLLALESQRLETLENHHLGWLKHHEELHGKCEALEAKAAKHDALEKALEMIAAKNPACERTKGRSCPVIWPEGEDELWCDACLARRALGETK